MPLCPILDRALVEKAFFVVLLLLLLVSTVSLSRVVVDPPFKKEREERLDDDENESNIDFDDEIVDARHHHTKILLDQRAVENRTQRNSRRVRPTENGRHVVFRHAGEPPRVTFCASFEPRRVGRGREERAL